MSEDSTLWQVAILDRNEALVVMGRKKYEALYATVQELTKERDEARADYEAQTDAWLKEHHRYNEAMDEVEKLKAEVERLREVVRQVHALASGSIVHSVSLHAIHNLTKGMVE